MDRQVDSKINVDVFMCVCVVADRLEHGLLVSITQSGDCSRELLRRSQSSILLSIQAFV